jgi:hypothetical protein
MPPLIRRPCRFERATHPVPLASSNLSLFPKHLLPTVISTEASRRLFPSFVRERVGLRSGEISLRSLVPVNIPRFTRFSEKFPRHSFTTLRKTFQPIFTVRTSFERHDRSNQPHRSNDARVRTKSVSRGTLLRASKRSCRRADLSRNCRHADVVRSNAPAHEPTRANHSNAAARWSATNAHRLHGACREIT